MNQLTAAVLNKTGVAASRYCSARARILLCLESTMGPSLFLSLPFQPGIPSQHDLKRLEKCGQRGSQSASLYAHATKSDQTLSERHNKGSCSLISGTI